MVQLEIGRQYSRQLVQVLAIAVAATCLAAAVVLNKNDVVRKSVQCADSLAIHDEYPNACLCCGAVQLFVL